MHEMSPDVATSLERSIRYRKEPIMSRLQRLVSLETPSGAKKSLDHFAKDLATNFTSLGASDVSLTPTRTGSHLIANFPGRTGERPLLLIGHSDTVWPVGTLDSTVPWTVNGDIVTGPGVFDMKSGLVIIEAALAALRDVGATRRPVRIIVSADEEVGSPTSREILLEAAQGIEAALGFESPHPDGALKIGRLGSTRVTLSVVGREAHAALEPEKGVSAIDELVDQLIKIRQLVASSNDRGCGTTLLNAGAIAGGNRANVVSSHAEALIGLRFENSEVEGRVLSDLDRLRPFRTGASVGIEVLTHRPSWQASAADHGLLTRIETIAAALDLQVDGRPAAGAADTNFVGAMGIPTLDGFGARGGGAHAPTEHVFFSSLIERAFFLAATLHSI